MSDKVRAGLDPSGVITHHFPAADYRDAFEIRRSGQSGKVVLDWA
jgi:threonine 3-dehydrogenase